jgi:hypothetical protein
MLLASGRCLAAAAFAASLCLASPAAANGHGPLFGGATPTLGKGGWQLDQAWMARIGREVDDDEQMLRTMIGFGITEDLQVSGSLPITLDSSVFMPRGRMMAMMSSAQDLEAMVGWRFQRRDMGPGARLESTLYAAVTAPLQDYRADGMKATPSLYVSAASGYASRVHYLWLSGGYQRFSERDGDRVGDSVTYSAVYGFRPAFLQVDYPKPDLRFFVEAVGEHTERGRHHGLEMVTSGGQSLLVGPTALLLYKAYGLEAGVLFPVYQRTNGAPEERMRLAVNFSYFFWRK